MIGTIVSMSDPTSALQCRAPTFMQNFVKQASLFPGCDDDVVSFRLSFNPIHDRHHSGLQSGVMNVLGQFNFIIVGKTTMVKENEVDAGQLDPKN